ncbi:AbrB/MazE/SpoVT family DNA-binding domain-containing protein [Hippea sp. KM1]|uniref:AbrB/MazE/SpoVT family DNA-binding domain-containing protein n=1 Tax=Hippea sp. KM1 TaxID=944481 RepID=UPI00046D5951|nr:AbrB/MazE/SpoVT family DNA-binding domain-containing protein [Hippea sp. KM1]
MHRTKVFKSGNSYAVRLPKEFRLNCDTVYIKKEGKRIVLIPPDDKWDDLFDRLRESKDITSEFMKKRNQPLPQERDLF